MLPERRIAFKSPSHLLTLSLSHALAQSTLLAHYESKAHAILQHPRTQALPRTLARTGALALSRRDAMRLTGKLFALRRDVVLGRNVLDVPGIFWEEASLHALYDAGRAYFEIGERVQALNERIRGARDLVRHFRPNIRVVDTRVIPFLPSFLGFSSLVPTCYS
jgi:uncharacterized Rmd1/YagE family protein